MQRARLPFPLLALALALVLLGSGCVSSAAPVAAFGDSVTWGYGGKPGGWVSVVEEQWGHPIANLGIPGETVGQALNRVDGPYGLALAPDAQVILVLHGGNDMVRAWSRQPCGRRCDPALVASKYDAIADDLDRIRDVAENGGRKVVFATYWPPHPGACGDQDPQEFIAFQAAITALNTEIVALAEARGAPVVRLDDLDEMPADPANYYDCLHPSGKGYGIIARRWMEDLPLWSPADPDAGWNEN